MLMRCGIGPSAHLREHGIAVRADMPGVGANLSNHSLLFIGFHMKPEARQSPSLRSHSATVLRFSSGVPGCPPTDMYINVQSKTSWSALGTRIANLAPSLWKPMGRGRVALRGADHRQEPLVEMNFAGHELDLKRLMVGFRLAVEMLTYHKVRGDERRDIPGEVHRPAAPAQPEDSGECGEGPGHRLADRCVPALAEPVFGTLADRRVDLTALVQDDDALAEHIRQNVAGMFHVAGTCRMGASTDRDAVVDRAGRVRGFDGLRVVDASIMPTVPRANTNIPTIMLAEKISAGIACRREDPRIVLQDDVDQPMRLWPTVFMYCSVSSSPTTSAYLALRSNRLCSCAAAERSPTASRTTIGPEAVLHRVDRGGAHAARGGAAGDDQAYDRVCVDALVHQPRHEVGAEEARGVFLHQQAVGRPHVEALVDLHRLACRPSSVSVPFILIAQRPASFRSWSL